MPSLEAHHTAKPFLACGECDVSTADRADRADSCRDREGMGAMAVLRQILCEAPLPERRYRKRDNQLVTYLGDIDSGSRDGGSTALANANCSMQGDNWEAHFKRTLVACSAIELNEWRV